MIKRTRSRIKVDDLSLLSLGDKVKSSVTREELVVEPLLLHPEEPRLRWLGLCINATLVKWFPGMSWWARRDLREDL